MSMYLPYLTDTASLPKTVIFSAVYVQRLNEALLKGNSDSHAFQVSLDIINTAAPVSISMVIGWSLISTTTW